MKILALLDQDTFVEGIKMNYTNEWIDEVVITYNAFKAKDFTDILENNDPMLHDIDSWVRKHNNTLVEIKEVL